MPTLRKTAPSAPVRAVANKPSVQATSNTVWTCVNGVTNGTSQIRMANHSGRQRALRSPQAKPRIIARSNDTSAMRSGSAITPSDPAPSQAAMIPKAAASKIGLDGASDDAAKCTSRNLFAMRLVTDGGAVMQPERPTGVRESPDPACLARSMGHAAVNDSSAKQPLSSKTPL